MLKPKKNPSDVKVRVQKTKVLIGVITAKLVIRIWCLLVSFVVLPHFDPLYTYRCPVVCIGLNRHLK